MAPQLQSSYSNCIWLERCQAEHKQVSMLAFISLCSWLLVWGDCLSHSCSDFHRDCLQPEIESWDNLFSSKSFCVNIFPHSDGTEIDILPCTISHSSLLTQTLILVIVPLHRQLMMACIASDILLVSNMTTYTLQAKSPATFKIGFGPCTMELMLNHSLAQRQAWFRQWTIFLCSWA